MNRSRGLLMLCGWMLAGTSLGAEPAAPRAVWTWEDASYAMLQSPEVAAEARAFLRGKRINILYLYADAHAGRNLIAEQPQRYREFIRRAHHDGMQVYALLGSYPLHTEQYVLPPRHADAEAMLQRVLDYNATAARSERFDGVNFDIEPHLLHEWGDATRLELLRGFLDMTAKLMARKHASGQHLLIGPAMPFWWDGIELDWHGARKPVSAHVIDICDYVALMDYRNHAEGRDGILAHAADEMAYAARVRKRVVIGLEMNPGDPAKLSFHGSSEAEFEAELAAVEQAYRGQPAFAGFVLHHYLGYRAWLAARTGLSVPP